MLIASDPAPLSLYTPPWKDRTVVKRTGVAAPCGAYAGAGCGGYGAYGADGG